MKLSKTLLKTIAVGLTLGAASSCGYLEDANNVEPRQTNDDTEQMCSEGTTEENGHVSGNCPACGMG